MKKSLLSNGEIEDLFELLGKGLGQSNAWSIYRAEGVDEYKGEYCYVLRDGNDIDVEYLDAETYGEALQESSVVIFKCLLEVL